MTDTIMEFMIGFLVVFAILLIPLTIYAAYVDAKEWEQFSKEQNCKVVGHKIGQFATGIGVTAGGKVGIVQTRTSSQTGYLCDDGITYWR